MLKISTDASYFIEESTNLSTPRVQRVTPNFCIFILQTDPIRLVYSAKTLSVCCQNSILLTSERHIIIVYRMMTCGFVSLTFRKNTHFDSGIVSKLISDLMFCTNTPTVLGCT